MAVIIWAIILTYTRAAYSGLALQIIAIAILRFKARREKHGLSKLNLLIIASAIAGALFVIPASGARVTAITDAADASITNRLAVYNFAETCYLNAFLQDAGLDFLIAFTIIFITLDVESQTA